MRLLFLLLLASPAFAQLQSNSLEVTATRTIAIQPDVVTFNVWVTAGVTVGMDAVVAALPEPFNASDFVSAAASFLNAGPGTQWYFSKTLPIASMGSALTSLNSAQANRKSSMTVTFSVQANVSAAAKAANPCVYGALMSDASAQARQTAIAAGLKLGPVISLSDGSDLPADQAGGAVYLVADAFIGVISRSGSFSAFAPPAPPTVCTLVVRFQLSQ